MDVSPAPSSDDQTSPVTWHVMIWILLSLAINSMGQFSVRWGASSVVYLASSPLICAADALSLIISIPCVWCMLGGPSLKTAIRFAVYWRLKGDSDGALTRAEHPSHAERLKWMFFIIGTAPALVKLAAFSGVPWSKTWGLMFGGSYLVVEFIIIMTTLTTGPLPRSTAEALGCSPDTWDEDANQGLRKKAEDLELALAVVSLLHWFPACLGQLALDIWMVYDLQPQRFLAERGVWMKTSVYNVMSKVTTGATLGFGLLVAVLAILWSINVWGRLFPPTKQEGLKRQNIMESMYRHLNGWWRSVIGTVTLALMVIGSFYTPQEDEVQQEAERHRAKFESTTVVSISLVCMCVYAATKTILWLICSKIPCIGRLVLVTKPDANVDELSPEAISKRDKALDNGVHRLTSFCLHVMLSILWYAMRYNPEETVNPSWTDIFG